MNTAWSTSLISGVVAAVAIAIGSALQFMGSSTPRPLPVAFIVGASTIIALVAGIFIAITVRSGLLFARCRLLSGRSSLIIAVVNVAILGILATVPVETHAIKLDMPSGQNGSAEVPLAFWLTIVVALLVPFLISYVVGRMDRGRSNAA